MCSVGNIRSCFVLKSHAMKAVSKLVFVVAMTIFPAIATASIETLSLSCSSNLVVSTENGYQANCDGDFILYSGTLRDDISIRLFSLGMLNIKSNVSLIAPLIELSGSSGFIEPGAILDAGYTGLPNNNPEILIPHVGVIKDPFILSQDSLILSQVPEPTNLSMLALGLLGVSLVARHKAK